MTLTAEQIANVILETFQHELSRNGHRRKNVMNCALYLVQEVRRNINANGCPKRELMFWDEVKSYVEKYA